MTRATPGVSVRIRMDEKTLARTKQSLQRTIERGTDLSAAYRKFSAYMHRVTVETFDRGGREGEWPELSPVTLALRASRGKRTNPRRMLQDRGILKGSFSSDITSRDMRFGTPVPYAQLHQEGGEATMELPAVEITPKKAKALCFISRTGEKVFAARVSLPRRSIKVSIPARPFLRYLPEDDRVLVRYVKEHVERNI